MSSLAPPERVWWKPLNREERLWVFVTLAVAVLLFVVMVAWMYVGKQNNPMDSYRVAPEDFVQATNRFIQQYQVRTEAGLPVVSPPAGGKAFLLARFYQWTPILELKKGQHYEIHLSSQDAQHGFSLQPININIQVLPGYAYILKLTPTQAGEFSIVCNEYCGPGHHLMTGKLIVRE